MENNEPNSPALLDNNVDDEPKMTKSEVENLIRQRVSKVQEALNAERLRSKELQDKLENSAALPSQQTSNEPANPVTGQNMNASTQNQSLTQEQVAKMLIDHENKAKQQKSFNDFQQKIQSAQKEDPEFDDLVKNAYTKNGTVVPLEHAYSMVSKMGDDALPVIKEILKNPEMNTEMLAIDPNSDPATLVSWAYKQHKKLSKNASSPDSSAVNVAPDIASEGGESGDDEMTKIRNMVSNYNI